MFNAYIFQLSFHLTYHRWWLGFLPLSEILPTPPHPPGLTPIPTFGADLPRSPLPNNSVFTNFFLLSPSSNDGGWAFFGWGEDGGYRTFLDRRNRLLFLSPKIIVELSQRAHTPKLALGCRWGDKFGKTAGKADLWLVHFTINFDGFFFLWLTVTWNSVQ